MTVPETAGQQDFTGILELLEIFEEQLGSAGGESGTDPDWIFDEGGMGWKLKHVSTCWWRRGAGGGRSRHPPATYQGPGLRPSETASSASNAQPGRRRRYGTGQYGTGRDGWG
jgi:hypothetical protein